jgi:pyruvate dehydrogenase E1 component alpha subunit
MEAKVAFAELMGRRTGSSHGVGGSMHLTDFSVGNIGANAIVGAGIPIAVGAAMSFRLRRLPRVALSFFGDGATNIGTFHEALNMAGVWQAPVVFVISNNLYGEYSPLRSTTPIDDLFERGRSFDIPGEAVDGQDVFAVHRATAKAIERARDGKGPTLLEMKTYRYRGHSRSDPAKYRPDGELDTWRSRDPISILGTRLEGDGVLSLTEQATLRDAIQVEIDDAARSATEQPESTLEEIAEYVYAG